MTKSVAQIFSTRVMTVIGATLWVGLVSGCAYHIGTGDRELPGGYRAISVPVFKNLSAETGAEIFFTNAIKRELMRSRLGRVTESDRAQVTLEGSIDAITYLYAIPSDDVQFTPESTVLNTGYRINIKSTIRVRRKSDKKLLWESTFTGEQAYLAPQVSLEQLNSVNALYNHSAHYRNIEIMAADMMSEAHDRLTENF